MEELEQIFNRILAREDNQLLRSVRKFSVKDCIPVVKAIGDSLLPTAFEIDDANRECYEKFISWVLCRPSAESGLDNTKGIYLAGPVGTGKTICMRVMRDFARELGVMVKWGTKADFLAWRTWRTDEVCDIYAQTGDLSEFKTARVACFEDLGTEPMEVLYMGCRKNPMREIIEYRGDDPSLITLFTSNVPPERLASVGQTVRYGQRAQSRIAQMCNYLVLAGADRRC